MLAAPAASLAWAFEEVFQKVRDVLIGDVDVAGNQVAVGNPLAQVGIDLGNRPRIRRPTRNPFALAVLDHPFEVVDEVCSNRLPRT